MAGVHEGSEIKTYGGVWHGSISLKELCQTAPAPNSLSYFSNVKQWSRSYFGRAKAALAPPEKPLRDALPNSPIEETGPNGNAEGEKETRPNGDAEGEASANAGAGMPNEGSP